MGVEGILIVVAVLLVIFVYYGGQIGDLVNSSSNTYLQQYANGIIKTQPTSGQSVCTLNVGFTPTYLTGFTTGQANIPNGANKISWIGCSGGIVPADFIPQFNHYIFNGQSFTTLMSLGAVNIPVSFNAVLIADDGTKLFPIVNPVSTTIVSYPLNNSVFSFDFTFVKVPRQHYVLQISSSTIGINSYDVGTTYSQQINP